MTEDEMVVSSECMLLDSVSSQQRFGVTDVKAPSACPALRSWIDSVIALRSRMDHVIALRQISVTAQCYSSILFRR